jgi:hypothetical protein
MLARVKYMCTSIIRIKVSNQYNIVMRDVCLNLEHWWWYYTDRNAPVRYKLYIKFRIVFWDVLPCKIIFDRRFRGACCLHHQGRVTHAPLKRQSTIILHGWLIPDDGGSTHIWNVGRQLFYAAVHPRRQFWTSYSPPWNLKSHKVI